MSSDPNISRVVLRLTRAVNHSDRAVKPILGQTDVKDHSCHLYTPSFRIRSFGQDKLNQVWPFRDRSRPPAELAAGGSFEQGSHVVPL